MIVRPLLETHGRTVPLDVQTSTKTDGQTLKTPIRMILLNGRTLTGTGMVTTPEERQLTLALLWLGTQPTATDLDALTATEMDGMMPLTLCQISSDNGLTKTAMATATMRQDPTPMLALAYQEIQPLTGTVALIMTATACRT